MNIVKNGEVVMMDERKISLYYLKAKAISGAVNVVHKLSLKVWHLRLGHLGEAGIKELAKRNLIELESPSEQLGLCE